MRFRTIRMLLAMVLVLPAMPSSSSGVDAEAEDELKSIIVKNFLRYSTWPETVPPSGPITVGVLGRTSFAQVLHGLLDGKPVNGRMVQTIELKSSSDSRRCHLIYVATDKNAEIKQALQSVSSSHALTIGETDKFLDYGGAVNLLLSDGHMGFEVSLEALDHAGIEISSKLLRLGQIKRRRTE
jgi:YfiR/HmsC-like